MASDEHPLATTEGLHEGTLLSSEILNGRHPEPRMAMEVLWEHRRFLLKAVAISLLASIVLAFALPKRYASTTRLMPPESGANGMSMISVLTGIPAASTLGASLLGLKSTGDLFVGVLDSETIQNRIIDKFDLRRVYGERTYEASRKQLTDYSEIAEDRKSGIITITVIDKDPQRAAGIAKEYVTQLDNVMASQSTSSARRERVFLEERLKLAKQELDDATVQYAQFASANKTIDLKEQGKAMIEGAATLKGQLIASESELSGLRQIYGPENSKVKAAEARTGRLRSELAKVTGQSAQADTDPDYIAPPLSKLPMIGVNYTELYRRLQIAESVYQALIKQYEIARVEEAKELPSVKVLDEAAVPEKKVSPPRTAIAVLGTLCGMLLAICFLVGRERFADNNSEGKQFVVNAWLELCNGRGPAKLQR
jgi:uncharacterized protein involved in exopolysaccharide biosynthesis